VLGLGGQPLAGAQVTISCVDDQGDPQFYDTGITRTDGSFTFTGVPSTSRGSLLAYLDDGDGYQSWGNTFASGGPNSFTLQPGQTNVEVTRTSDSSWNWWRWLRVET
jgi:hypothetical protein